MNLRFLLTGLTALVGLTRAQSSSSSAPAPSNSPQVAPTVTFVETLLPTTIPFNIGTTFTVSGRVRESSIVSGVVFTATSYIMETYIPTPTASNAAAASPTSTEPPSIHLETKVNGAFAMAGVLLILTGLPMTFWGHKNRWSSIFLIGFYTFALTCIVLIIRFGVLQGVKPPTVKLEGLFLLASAVAGIIGGAIFIFFWKGTRYSVGAWGGFALALWIECFKAGGIIKPVGFRWFFYIALAVIGFVACTFPKTHYPTMLISTAIVGATSLMLGVDCFTTAGLKEFYIWNLGFTSLFPTFSQHVPPIQYPISQTMVIELGLVGAIAVMGAAVQLRFLQVFMQRLKEITQAEAQREQEREEKAAQRFTGIDRDRLLWEKEHGTGRDSETLGGRRTEDGKLRSVDLETGLSTPDLKGPAAPIASSFMPTLDFGNKATAAELSSGLLPNETDNSSMDALAERDPELREKMKLLEEIRRVKQNIEALREQPSQLPLPPPPRSASPTQTVYTGLLGADRSSSGNRSRTNSRPLSTASMPIDSSIPEDQEAPLTASPTRPPRAAKPDPRHRTRSHDGSYALGLRHSLLDNDDDEDPLNLSKTLKVPQDPAKMHWDQYTKDRSLFTPPSGMTAAIPASDYVVPVSPAVQEALERRMAREAALESGEVRQAPIGRAASPRASGEPNRHSVGFPDEGVVRSSSQRYPPQLQAPKPSGREDATHRRQASGSTNVIVVPNPPKAKTHNKTGSSPPPITPPPRVVTAGELDERHRQRMKALQRPITEREAEQAKLDEAKARWENSRRIERTVMERKEKELRRTSNEQVTVEEEEQLPRRSADTRGRSDKVAEWQQRQSMVHPPARRKSTANQGDLRASPVSPGFGNGGAGSRGGSMEIPNPQQRQSLDRPPILPAARHERRPSSRSLDAWNVYSSPGNAMRPPPN
ncbi:hypothetical protein M407DRAFT_27545 [Tulasnella calospora MUT 4182]|uniref:TM7S3/TM198-like domain-containing protein n=1 Tax=Tulasnella calospora MUT 4182 TaxID=1051891 RepID=A0A0C3QDR0_9AGAM|nr:hypothetical protein M407DRAFT_27545 [Tulasnella calospora MUT 4182]